MARPLVHDEAGLSNLWTFVGVVLLITAMLGVYFVYVVPRFPGPPLQARSGDFVEVDYIGTFAENGLVFDTSLAAVAADNASYRKAFAFSWREGYTPLAFTVGTGAVVKGFDLGVQGLAVGETKTIVVPPALGYGPAQASKIVVKPLFESVPVRITLNGSDFFTTYRSDPVSGTNVTDPFWGWPATVSVAGSVVTVTNSPLLGELVQPHGVWSARVISIDSTADSGRGTIVVQHLLDATAVDRIGKATTDPQGRRTIEFIVTAVDSSAGTYTLNYNDATKGRELVFTVTMTRISRSY